MNGIWVMFKDADTEYVTLYKSFDIVKISGVRELYMSTEVFDLGESDCVTTENSHDIDAIMDTIKNAITFGMNYVMINLDNYVLDK